MPSGAGEKEISPFDPETHGPQGRNVILHLAPISLDPDRILRIAVIGLVIDDLPFAALFENEINLAFLKSVTFQRPDKRELSPKLCSRSLRCARALD